MYSSQVHAWLCRLGSTALSPPSCCIFCSFCVAMVYCVSQYLPQLIQPSVQSGHSDRASLKVLCASGSFKRWKNSPLSAYISAWWFGLK